MIEEITVKVLTCDYCKSKVYAPKWSYTIDGVVKNKDGMGLETLTGDFCSRQCLQSYLNEVVNNIYEKEDEE